MTKKLIAEFCQNHNGEKMILDKMISAAKLAGATHAKIQGLYAEELTFRPEFEQIDDELQISENRLIRPYDAEVKRLLPLTLDESTEKWFVERCHELNIIPMITVFTHVGVDRANSAGFKSIKIASYDCASIPMISRILDFASELVISTGATSWNDVKKTSDFLKSKNKNIDISFLHAVTEYPNSINNTRLLRMNALSLLGHSIGFSDHTSPVRDGLLASSLAIMLGAEVIERHFTILDRSQTKDGPVSVDPDQLNQLHNLMFENSKNTISELLPPGTDYWNYLTPIDSLEPSQAEIKNAKYYRGRVASKKNDRYCYSWEEWLG